MSPWPAEGTATERQPQLLRKACWEKMQFLVHWVLALWNKFHKAPKKSTWSSHEAHLHWWTLVPLSEGAEVGWRIHNSLDGTPPLHHPWHSAPPHSTSICQTFPWAVSTARGLGFPDSKESFFVAEKCLHLLVKPQKFSPGRSSNMCHRSNGFTAVWGLTGFPGL